MEQIKYEKNIRIEWVDISKGIGIILVIWAHTLLSGGVVSEKLCRGAVFSFHMPLFFFLSGVTNKVPADWNEFIRKTEKLFKQLCFPAVGIFLLRIIFEIICGYNVNNTYDFLRLKINILIYGSGVPVKIGGSVIPAFGMMWFLISLFTCKTIYNYLSLKKDANICYIIFITFLGVVLSKIQFLPFTLDTSLAVLIFFYLGNKKVFYKRDFGNIKIFLFFLICFFVWFGSLTVSLIYIRDYLEIAERRYPLFPLCYLTAIFGVFMIVWFSKGLEKFSVLRKTLTWLGKNSIILFCVHAMDDLFIYIYDITANNIINGVIRVFFDVLICAIFVFLGEKLNGKTTKFKK